LTARSAGTIREHLFAALMNAAVVSQPSPDTRPTSGTTLVIVAPPAEEVENPTDRRPTPANLQDLVLPL
jgi:hypothetical protein